jgi:hypothetical protein
MGWVRKKARLIDKNIIRPIVRTVEAIVEDPRKLAMVALSVLAPGAGTALGTAMGLTGTAATVVGQVAINTALNGGDVKSAIISAAIPVVGKELAGAASSAFVDAGLDQALAKTAGNAVTSAGLAAIQGGDPVTALLASTVPTAVASVANEIPGYSELPELAKKAIASTVTSSITGGGGPQATANTIVNAGINALAGYAKTPTETTTQPALPSPDADFVPTVPPATQDVVGFLRSAYDAVTGAKSGLDSNIAEQNKIAEQYNAKLAETQALQNELAAKYDKYTQLTEEGSSGIKGIANIVASTVLADEINSGVAQLNANKSDLSNIAASLDTVKTQYTGLEGNFLEKKSALDENVLNYQQQQAKLGSELTPTPTAPPATEDVVQQLQDAGLVSKAADVPLPLIQEEPLNPVTVEQNPNVDDLLKSLDKYKQAGAETSPPLEAAIPTDTAPVAPDVVAQLLNSNLPSPDADFAPTISLSSDNSESVFDPTFGGILPMPDSPATTDWNALYNTGLSEEEIAKREALMESLPGQDMQITPENWDSYNKNLTDIIENKGGYTSQWQTVGNDRVLVNDDGTGIGTNENGDSYALSREEVSSMIKNGLLNTADSGYVAATGGTGNTPGGSGPAPTTPPSTATPPSTVTPPKTVTPTKPGTTTQPTGTTPTGITLLGLGQQQLSNADLLNILGSKPELANIKSFKELFGEGLFGDSYVPPSAGGEQTDSNSGSDTASQNEDAEQLFTGGHVDDFDVDALLRILRG